MRAILSSLVILCGLGVWASGPASATEIIDVGPAIGSAIPDAFNVRDANGTERTYADVAGAQGLVLAFVRSASWCPFCQSQMKDLQNIAADLKERGYELAVLSYDEPKVLDQFAKKQGITYTLLSDEGSKVIDAFDVRDPQYGEESMAYGVPQPVIFIIDPAGTVQGKLALEGYRDRPPLEDVMAEVERILGKMS